MRSAALGAALVLLASGLILSCRPEQAATGTQAKLSRPGAPPAAGTRSRRFIVALVDWTGSFPYLQRSIARLGRCVLEEITAGDELLGLKITDKLGEPEPFFPKLVMPLPQARIGDPAVSDGLTRKVQVLRTLQHLARAPGAKTFDTDLLTSLAYSCNLLRVHDSERWVLAFTDLDDTAQAPVEPDLRGIHVRVYYVPLRGNLRELEAKRARWLRKLTRAGAASCKIFDAGQTELLGCLLDKSAATSCERTPIQGSE